MVADGAEIELPVDGDAGAALAEVVGAAAGCALEGVVGVVEDVDDGSPDGDAILGEGIVGVLIIAGDGGAEGV